jgi:hypothetical protein
MRKTLNGVSERITGSSEKGPYAVFFGATADGPLGEMQAADLVEEHRWKFTEGSDAL